MLNKKEKLKQKIRDDHERNEMSKDLVASSTMVMECPLTDIQLYDIKELMAYSLVSNLRRKECLDICTQYLETENIEVGNEITSTEIIQIYNSVRKALFKRTEDTIQIEREMYYMNMTRLALKCEAANDFGNAIKAYKEVAELAGVFKHKDDNTVILNFTTAKRKDK